MAMYKYFISRLPDRASIVRVFATAAFLVYGWTIYSSFWKIPSWIYFLTTGEIFSVYTYSFVTNFVESVFLTLGLIVIGFFLFDNLWKNSFSAAGVITVVVMVGAALVHLYLYQDPNLREEFIDSQRIWWTVVVFVAFFLSIICVRVTWLGKFLNALADRFVVFLYIYLPLTLMSFIFIIVRIVF
jgi:hypothetical protein